MRGGGGRLISEGAFHRKTKSPSKQVIAVLIKIRFVLLVFNFASNYHNESISCLSKQEKPEGAHVRGRRGLIIGCIFLFAS